MLNCWNNFLLFTLFINQNPQFFFFLINSNSNSSIFVIIDVQRNSFCNRLNEQIYIEKKNEIKNSDATLIISLMFPQNKQIINEIDMTS